MTGHGEEPVYVITFDWRLTSAARLWEFLARELPVVADQKCGAVHTVLMKLPGAELPAVVCDQSPLLIAPPAHPLDTSVKYLYLDLLFPPPVLDALHAGCGGQIASMCAEINATFAAALRN